MRNKFLAVAMCAAFMVSLSTVNSKVSYAEAPPTTAVSESSSDMRASNSQELTKEQVIEDIDFVLDVIKQNHASSVKKIPDEVLKQKDIEINNLSERTSIIDVYRIICRILSKLHEAHSTVISIARINVPDCLTNRLPFDTEFTDEKFICKNGEFSGYSLISINDTTIEDLYKTFKEHLPHEIDEWTYHNFFETSSRFISGAQLSLSGIDTSKSIKITFQKDDEIKSKEFDLVPIKVPNTISEEWFFYEIDKENNLGIFKLNECTFNDEYKNKVHDFFLDVQKNNIKNIVIDVRKNYGGDSHVIDYFMMYLKNLPSTVKCFSEDVRENDKLTHGYYGETELTAEDIEFGNKLPLYDGNIYVLTSHGTFSSGMWFAVLLSDNNLAQVIGEVPGNSPTSFGDCSSDYGTPNSKI